MNPFEAQSLGLISPDAVPYARPLGAVTTTKVSQYWVVRAVAGTTLAMDWGDGSTDWLAATGSDQVFQHTYAGPGTYSPQLCVQLIANLQKLDCSSNGLTGALQSLAAAAGLAYFSCRSNPGLTGGLPSFASNTALTFLDVHGCGLTGALPSFNTCTLLQNADFGANSFTGAIPVFSACTALQRILFGYNGFTSYPSQVLASTLVLFDASECALPQASIDTILANVVTGLGARPAGGTLHIPGASNGTPGAQGLADTATILAKPWTVNTNATPVDYFTREIVHWGGFDLDPDFAGSLELNTQPVPDDWGFDNPAKWSLSVANIAIAGSQAVCSGLPGTGQAWQSNVTIVAGNRYVSVLDIASSNGGTVVYHGGYTDLGTPGQTGLISCEYTAGSTRIGVGGYAGYVGACNGIVSSNNTSIKLHTPHLTSPNFAAGFAQSNAIWMPWARTAKINGKQCTEFDSDMQIAAGLEGLWRFLHDGSGCTIFFLSQRVASTSYLLVSNDGTGVNGINNLAAGVGAAGSINFQVGVTGSGVVYQCGGAAGSYPEGVPTLLEMSCDSISADLYSSANGALVTDVTPTAPLSGGPPNHPLRIMSRASSANSGIFGGMVVVAARLAPNSPERLAIRAMMKARWGI